VRSALKINDLVCAHVQKSAPRVGKLLILQGAFFCRERMSAKERMSHDDKNSRPGTPIHFQLALQVMAFERKKQNSDSFA
jgi:hypothetical protein